MKKTVLFLCTHNSARSQMAEGLLNYYFGDEYGAFSAGTEKTKVNPFAIQAMNDSGIDISSHYSKTLDEFLDNTFDYVVTVCDNAKENCPYFSNAKVMIHNSFEDPSAISGSDEEKLGGFIKTRDLIKDWLEHEFSNL